MRNRGGITHVNLISKHFNQLFIFSTNKTILAKIYIGDLRNFFN